MNFLYTITKYYIRSNHITTKVIDKTYTLVLGVLKIKPMSLQNLKPGSDTICNNLKKALATSALIPQKD